MAAMSNCLRLLLSNKQLAQKVAFSAVLEVISLFLFHRNLFGLTRPLKATFYCVTDSVGPDSSQFMTGMLEITPRQLKFEKTIEILMRHYLFVEGGSSKVTVLYHSGKSTESSLTSLCQLTSINESIMATGMTMTLWEDFVHIETSRICRFDLLCEGKSYIEVWASLYALKTPHPEQLGISLFLTLIQLKPSDEKFKCMYMTSCELECRYGTVLSLSCEKKEDLKVTVETPLSTQGWKAMGNTDLSQTILYKDIQDMVVQNRPCIRTDFGFDKTSNVGVTDGAPALVFMLNRTRCILFSPAL